MPRPVLVTCGATRNPVDAIRYLSAFSSGRTGVSIACALAGRGHPVHVLGSPEALLRLGEAAPGEAYTSTRDLMARMERWVRAKPGGAVVHSAAVGDYEARAEAGKIPSGQETLVIHLSRAPKIADQITGWDAGCFLVTFKAAGPETPPEKLVAICRAQLERTGSSLVFGNVIGALSSSAVLVDAGGHAPYPDRAAAIDALVARVAAV